MASTNEKQIELALVLGEIGLGVVELTVKTYVACWVLYRLPSFLYVVSMMVDKDRRKDPITRLIEASA